MRHQIPKPKCSSFRYRVVFAQSIEAMQVLSWEWRCRWRAISNFIAYSGVTYIRGLTVVEMWQLFLSRVTLVSNISFVNVKSIQWRHSERDGVSNHQPHDCLLNCLFRQRWKKHQSSASLAFVQWPVNSPHKGPETRKMFPFDDVIMFCYFLAFTTYYDGALHLLV